MTPSLCAFSLVRSTRVPCQSGPCSRLTPGSLSPPQVVTKLGELGELSRGKEPDQRARLVQALKDAAEDAGAGCLGNFNSEELEYEEPAWRQGITSMY